MVSIVCRHCGARFCKSERWFDLTPAADIRASEPSWQAWEQLQANGVASYKAEPIQNLSVGERADCRSFGAFCRFEGAVLDVGCGPQAWPAYFDRDADAMYVGIDPLVSAEEAEFLKIRGLAERLPFRAGTFQRVLFSTTIDHFVDSAAALEEARRVCAPEGEVDVWFGEKDPSAPRPATSPEWYRQLKRPELADDVFHVRRLTAKEFRTLATEAGLRIVDEERHVIDPYRTNWFFRLHRA